jgi:hypothetical protein
VTISNQGFSKALGSYSDRKSGDVEADSAVEHLSQMSGVAQFIVEALKSDDAKFVVFPTALQIVRAMLRERHLFGIPGSATENSFIRLGPPKSTSYSRLDLRLSVPETGDIVDWTGSDPKFAGRVLNSPHPENLFRRAV